MSHQAVQPHLKFPSKSNASKPGMTIWDVPGSGLYRVRRPFDDLDVDPMKVLLVETLSPVGWIELIRLGEDETQGDHEEAMRIWIAIQTPVPQSAGEEAADD